MKELSIEEKAKRYDEAIKKAKEYFNSPRTCFDIEQLCNVFPELKEKEDEMVRKSLLEYLHTLPNHYTHSGVCALEWIAWLEKQELLTKEKALENSPFVEQKPTKYTLEQAAHIFLGALSDTPYNNKPITDAQVITNELLKFLSDASSYNPNALNEQNPAWSEEDERIIKQLTSLWSEVMIEPTCCRFGLHKDEVIHWLKSLKDRVQPQPKQEWSEEDEKMLGYATKAVYNMYVGKHHSCVTDVYVKTANWLKSLKDRCTWKPSDEQMLALEAVLTVSPQSPAMTSALIELYQNLKELRGE